MSTTTPTIGLKPAHLRLFAALLCFILLATALPTQGLTIHRTIASPTYSITFDPQTLTVTTTNGYDTLIFPDAATTGQPGTPAIPSETLVIAVPATTIFTAVRILAATTQPLPGTYTLPSLQPPQTINSLGGIPAILSTLTTISDPYPASPIQLTGESDLYGQGLASLRFTPIQYHIATHTITVTTSLTIQLVGIPGRQPGDYLPSQTSPTDQQQLTTQVQNMVINPDAVRLQTNPKPHTTGVPAGDYDYVIITKTDWVSAFQPLANWKTQKGIRATIVTTDWIYNSGGYSGSNVDKIKAFVQDAYNTWGATFFLIGGDIDTVPCHYKTYSDVDYDPVPNDTYYADFDGDYVCEVNVGRASVTGTGTGNGKIGTFINKVLTYEQNPPASFPLKASMFGFDLDSSTHAQQCKISIDNNYIPSSWTMTNVYDSDSGNHKTNVLAALNAGQNLINHADHSNEDSMGTGYINHNYLISSSDMDALTNGNKQGILYSMGCDPAAYDTSACIAEHYVRNANGGGIAFIGNSRYGWYEYGSYDTLSMGFDQAFFHSLFTENYYKLGQAFSDHKNDAVSSDSYDRYIYTELTLLGDPELPVWTANPSTFTVTHPSTLPLGSSSFTVHVTNGGSPVNQAYVCLWKGTEVYLTGTTNTNGDVTFTPAPTTIGTMNVTVTKQNYLPNATTATVVNNGNTPPEAFDDYVNVIMNSANNQLDVKANDHDDDGDAITITSVTQPAHGQSSTDGAYAYYTPTTNYYGQDSFTYTISDNHGGTDTATVYVTVINNDIPPIANNDTITTNEDVPIWISGLANDYDPDGTIVPSSVTVTMPPSHGSTTVNTTTGTIRYSPQENYNGADSFVYRITDNQGATDTATVSITILSVNDPPTASFTYQPEEPQISQTIFFNSTSSDVDGAIVNWTWDFGDGSMGYGERVTHSYTVVQAYIAALTATDDQGATDSASTIVAVSALPLTAHAGGPYTGMQGCPVTFTGNATGGTPPYNYQWSFGDGTTSTEPNPSHTYRIGDNFTVTFLVVDSIGRNNSDVTTATISRDSLPPTVSLVTPVANMLYLFNRPVFPLARTIIIGPVLVTVHASDDQTGVNHVEIYVDGGLMAYTSVGPEYQWQWTIPAFGSKTLRVVAIDNAGNIKTTEMNVIKIL